MILKTLAGAPVLALALLLAACAAQVQVAPATMAALAAPAGELQVAADLPIRLSTGYTRTVPAGSRWRAVGTLPQGTVFQPIDSVFAIEGRNVHEAYLVIQGGALQGFYLPGEGNFSPLSPAIQISTRGAQR